MENVIKFATYAVIVIVPTVVTFVIVRRYMAFLVRGAYLADFATLLVAGFCAGVVALGIGGALWGR